MLSQENNEAMCVLPGADPTSEFLQKVNIYKKDWTVQPLNTRPRLKKIFLGKNCFQDPNNLKVSSTRQKKLIKPLRKIKSLPNKNIERKATRIGKKKILKNEAAEADLLTPMNPESIKTPMGFGKKNSNDLERKTTSQISPSSSKKRDLKNLEMIKNNFKKQMREENIKIIDKKIEKIATKRDTNRLFDYDHMRNYFYIK